MKLQRLKVQRAPGLAFLDIEKLDRAPKAEFELGQVKAGRCQSTVLAVVRHHHEWWDGTGYPAGLAGEDIPIAARITALADVFDALAHKRPYKVAWSLDSTLTEIMSLSGRQFDPKLTDLFLGLVGRLRREHVDLDAFLGEAADASPFLQARKKIKETLLQSVDDREHGSESRLNLQR